MIKLKKTCSNIKMGKELLTFGNIETKNKNLAPEKSYFFR